MGLWQVHSPGNIFPTRIGLEFVEHKEITVAEHKAFAPIKALINNFEGFVEVVQSGIDQTAGVSIKPSALSCEDKSELTSARRTSSLPHAWLT